MTYSLRGQFYFTAHRRLCTLDSFLQKIVSQLPGCLKYAEYLLRNIDGINCQEVLWLCTLDIKRLYTNSKEGIMALRDKLSKDPKLSNHIISFLMTLLDLVLTRNYFRFGSDVYLQLQGTSIGSPAAPSFANIFMA